MLTVDMFGAHSGQVEYWLISTQSQQTDRHISIKSHNFHDSEDIYIICSGFTNTLIRAIYIHITQSFHNSTDAMNKSILAN